MFLPIVSAWFRERFGEPTEAQRRGWPHIVAGRNTLIAAPTGSGKTLAAFLTAIDRLLREANAGTLADGTQVLYVSPLKALSNDIQRNLQTPLEEIRHRVNGNGANIPTIRVVVRTGDTSPAQRQAMLRRPPHILVTTPESLYLLLTAAKSRDMLRSVKTVIVDEIHALARDKRGSHLSLSLERLEALCDQAPVRIGLSATQRPVDQIACFLVGTRRVDELGRPDCAVVDLGHARSLDLALEVPPTDLSSVCSHETWDEIYQRLEQLIQAHRSTLIFVNTRRMAERVAYRLSETIGKDAVASHHGSLSQEIRHTAEQRLKAGGLKAIVATASLELGIDVGFIDLVCQIGSPRSISTVLQRVGRSGHALGLVPKGRLFPLTRDELLECLALVHAVRAGKLDQIKIPNAPLDILAQQIVATVASEPCGEDELYKVCRGAWSYRKLSRDDFDQIVTMVSEGITPALRRGAFLHRDRINGQLRPRRGARLAALGSGGAIPDTADYRVITEDERAYVGSVNEDFALESLAGDVFILGNTSWRIRHVRGGEVVVRDAHAAPATIPFWLGEAPARTDELSAQVSRLRSELERRVDNESDWSAAAAWLKEACGADESTARQAASYLSAQKAAMGLVPNHNRIVFERFFDETGGMQVVIHAPLGARINRAWGLALRKRFCRSFDFELQAAANDNGIVLSLGPQHSVPTERLFRLVQTHDASHILTQAMLAVPMFQTRWRWNTTRALAVLRRHGGKKIPAPLQRFRADDTLTAVFPAQTACFENRPEDVPIPDHPLVRQTIHDCLHEATDVDQWLQLLEQIERGDVELIARDTREPSPFSHELLNANPYAFLDDAPLEERRARAVATRRTLDIESLRDLGRLDPQAIEQVRADAWPTVRDADELHDALLTLVLLPERDADVWDHWMRDLIRSGRATVWRRPNAPNLYIAAERSQLVTAIMPDVALDPPITLPEGFDAAVGESDAWLQIVRGQIECLGPVCAQQLADRLGLPSHRIEASLEILEAEGSVLRGNFSVERSASTDRIADGVQWCDRRLLSRIHRLTLETLRRQIRPVELAEFLRFLMRHQRVAKGLKWHGEEGVREAIGQLEGFEMAAGSWEQHVLSARVEDNQRNWLDELTLSGAIGWGRLRTPHRNEESRSNTMGINRMVPISLFLRADVGWLLPCERPGGETPLHSHARLVHQVLQAHGALFFDDLLALTDLLPGHLEAALHELAALGMVTADSFAAIRSLVAPAYDRQRTIRRKSRRQGTRRAVAGGRWSRFPGPVTEADTEQRVQNWAWLLLRRYGVVFRDLLIRETIAPPWAQLLPVLRRLESSGQVRGGRFVTGVAGEQFATEDSIVRLRAVRNEAPDNELVIISAADPLNLTGITTSPRIVASHANLLVLCDGRVVASHQSGKMYFHEDMDGERADNIASRLSRLVVTRVAT